MFYNKIRYLFLLVFLGIISILYNVHVVGIIFITVVALPFVLFVTLCLIHRLIKAELTSTAHVVTKNEEIPITLTLDNPTFLPIYAIKVYITYNNDFSSKKYQKEYMVAIDGKSRTSITYNFMSEFSGIINISLKKIRCYDPLKLFSLKKRCNEQVKIAVLPNFYDIEEDIVSRKNKSSIESDNYSDTKRGDDPSEVFAIREYREGDRPSQIHWKLSSKQEQLMVKEFSDPLNCSILIFLDFTIQKGRDRLKYMDGLIESALSISYNLLIKKETHYFSWFDSRLGACMRIKISSDKDFYEAAGGILEALPVDENDNTLGNYMAEYGNEQYSQMFLITGEISQAIIEELTIFPSFTKQVLYIEGNKVKSPRREPDIKDQAVEYIKRLDGLEIDLIPINIKTMSKDIQELKLS